MKKAVFKFFDEFCYGELVFTKLHDDDDVLVENSFTKDWGCPKNVSDAFGYSKNEQILFFCQEIENSVRSIYGVGRTDFKEYFGEWFVERYKLPVSRIL
jgi:hypothetical protein